VPGRAQLLVDRALRGRAALQDRPRRRVALKIPRARLASQRTLRRFYLRLLLGAYLGVPGKEIAISRQVKGKPVLRGRARRRLDFSMANSDGCCLIGICSDGLVGVDVLVGHFLNLLFSDGADVVSEGLVVVHRPPGHLEFGEGGHGALGRRE